MKNFLNESLYDIGIEQVRSVMLVLRVACWVVIGLFFVLLSFSFEPGSIAHNLVLAIQGLAGLLALSLFFLIDIALDFISTHHDDLRGEAICHLLVSWVCFIFSAHPKAIVSSSDIFYCGFFAMLVYLILPLYRQLSKDKGVE